MTEISCLDCPTRTSTRTVEPMMAFPGGCAHETLPRKVFLVRHGLSVWNRTGRVTGQLNPRLSEPGQEQAARLEEVLRCSELTAIYTSTLDRAIETALPTARALGLDINRRQELCEQHMGVVQGRFRDERDPEAKRYWWSLKRNPGCFCIPGGESFSDLRSRVSPCLDEILKTEAGGAVLIVGHRNTNRAILQLLLGLPERIAHQQKLTDRFLYEIMPGEQPNLRTISLRGHDLGMAWKGFRG